MKTVIIIPARYASSRLPGKPLLRQTGKYLVQHVYERACQARRADRVVVATDDSRIVAAVESFQGQVAWTRRDHPSGTDRVAEVARKLEEEVIVNLQGDEPLIEPASLDLLPELLARDSSVDMATLATPITSLEQLQNPNCVKVVCDNAGHALYFSRSPIPYVRDSGPTFTGQPCHFMQHLGIYAYRREFLLKLAQLPPSPLEKLEKLEQLRALAWGHGIAVAVVKQASVGVDTYEDYERFVQFYQRKRTRTAA